MSKFKIPFFITLVLGLLAAGYYGKRKWYDPAEQISKAKAAVRSLIDRDLIHDGDLIFQTSLSPQSKAIQLATHSELSHCGIIFKSDSGYYVLEAVQPVKYTPLERWIARGKDMYYTIKRLKNASTILTDSVIESMKTEGKNFLGKNYDIYFGWSDEKIYCSELIWKIYNQATGLCLGRLQQLKDFDLTDTAVKELLQKRYGNAIPYEDTVISPVSIYQSDLLLMIQ